MSYYLFLDDERNPSDVTWIELPEVDFEIVRNYAQFVSCIESRGLPLHISFDNDLGDKEPEGRDCVKWIVGQMLDGEVEGRFAYTVHSKNVVAAAWIQQYLDKFFEIRGDV